ncbi:MAG TPA: hypothetical protein VH482_23070, partial [Thermomicrobiales bacterium]
MGHVVGRRITRWTRWRTAVLVVLLLLPGTPETLARLSADHAARDRALAALAPGRNTLPAQPARHQAAPPAASGAYPPYPLNHSLDADVVTLPGSPTDHDFETAAYSVGTAPTDADLGTTPADVGTPPTNHDFATGALSPWHDTGSAAIAADVDHGSYARLPSGTASVTTAAFTVDATAQAFVVDVGYLGTGANSVLPYVLSGANY